MLRSGGLGVRDLRRLARHAGVPDATAALLLEVAWAAGLLGEAPDENGEASYLPTVGYDGWRAMGIAARWLRLVTAWLRMSRDPAIVGQRDDKRLVNVLSSEVERAGAPGRRVAALSVLSDAPEGTVIAPDDVTTVLAWRAPRRATRASATGVTSALAEAALLGLTGLGAVTGYGRLLLAEPERAEDDPLGIAEFDSASHAGAVKALDTLIPSPIEHVLLQTDLTIVVPGPADPTLAAELALVAEAESPSVFRITPVSIRRALDVGFAASDLHQLFAKRSRTPVPQPLTYLINDVARKHGGLRVGSAGAYLRGEDEALLTEVLADRRLAGLGLRRLAPTVLTTPFQANRLLAAVREAGYTPVKENETGEAVLVRPKTRRAAARGSVPRRRGDDLAGMPDLSEPRLAGVVEQIRRGEAAARAARRAPVAIRTAARTGASAAQAHTQAMATLQQALRDRVRVWVGYVDAHGSAASRLLRPVSMGGGYLRAEDERTETVHTFALHRITGAELEQ